MRYNSYTCRNITIEIQVMMTSFSMKFSIKGIYHDFTYYSLVKLAKKAKSSSDNKNLRTDNSNNESSDNKSTSSKQFKRIMKLSQETSSLLTKK